MGQAISTNVTELDAIEPTSSRASRRGWIRLLVFLGSFAVSLAAFLVFDWAYSAAVKRASEPLLHPNLCRIPDPIRQHGLEKNCASTVRWGNAYQFYTNSIGLRDEKIRTVPLTDPRPRILLLGDSFTEGQATWNDTFAGQIAGRLPQYDFLDGGVVAYSPSNYFNLTRGLLADGYHLDEVIVFLDTSAVHLEAAFYGDKDASGAVQGPAREHREMSWYGEWRFRIAANLFATFDMLEFLERQLVNLGFYHLRASLRASNTFDEEEAAWSYRQVNETDLYPTGFAPLGVKGGLAKQKAKMDLLCQELERRNIPISVVVYPYPSQLVHDSADSQQVRIWREWCAGKCNRFISLYPAFFAVKEQCPRLEPGCWYSQLFVFGDVHFTTAGNAMVADAVIQSLTAEPPVKRPGNAVPPEPGVAGQRAH